MNTNITTQAQAGFLLFNPSTSITHDGVLEYEPTLQAAKAAVLTTRTDNDTGTFTSVGHGYSNGDELDVYWVNATTGAEESRYGMIVSSSAADTFALGVAGGEIGAGDNLPPQSTALYVCKRTVIDIADFAFNTLGKYLLIQCANRAIAEFFTIAPASLLVAKMSANAGYVWHHKSGFAVPLGGAVASGKASQMGTTAVAIKCALGYDA